MNLNCQSKANANRVVVNRLTSALLFAGLATFGFAFAASGTFTYVNGAVLVQKPNGQRLIATVGMEVEPNDLVRTAANGMAQLAMIDQARISLRGNSDLRIDRYSQTPEGTDGAVLSLLRGTLRTFTALLSRENKEKYQMRTRVATVGIRGSGNILTHTDEGTPTTLNHTIEGSHEVADVDGKFASIITAPNDTIKVELGKAPVRVPTPSDLIAAVTDFNGAIGEDDGSGTRLPGPDRPNVVGGNGLGFSFDNKIGTLGTDPIALQDILIGNGGTVFGGQAVPTDITRDATNLRGYRSYAGAQSNEVITLNGGTIADANTFNVGAGTTITIGRWNNATSVGINGQTLQSNGSIHWGYANSGFPTYLSDVLTGTVSYQRVGATSPTNQFGVVGTLVSTVLDVNFTARTLNASVGITIPAGGSGATATPANSWTLQANNLAFALNSFSATTGSGLTITNGAGQSSATNNRLSGSLQGSFVGATLNGAIVGYGVIDRTANGTQTATGTTSGIPQIINGVIAFQGPSQNGTTQYRDGLVSDPNNALQNASYIRSFATTNRVNEVTVDSQGRASAFAAPYVSGNNLVGHQAYAVGSATVSDAGFDPSTGLVWGRWSGGTANVGGQNIALANRSLHYIFSGVQSLPVALPLTGTGTYDVIGSTNPTDLNGNVGRLNSASLNANFSARTVDSNLNFTINNQTWNASAANVPIYRNQYFSAYAGGTTIAGVGSPTQLLISCTPNCTPTLPTGSLDGFFTGRTGQGAAVMYNVNNNSGAVAFRRKGG
jgi:hypothetical protein